MTTVQLQRRGVSKDCFYCWFNPCAHGERNHIEFIRHYRGFWLVNWSLPNCHTCHMTSRGQTARRWECPIDDFTAAKDTVTRETQLEFAPEIEAYMAYSDCELRVYPYLASDVYLCAASYEPETNTIRHDQSNLCLIALGPIPDFDVDQGAAMYRPVCEKAHEEFLKEINQRRGERGAKAWLAWLVSEYIKDEFPGERPVKRSSPVRV
jgi:hypothetical protein